MPNILFFTNKVTEKHTEILNKLASILEGDVLKLNIPQHRPEDHIKPGSMVVSFGKVAGTMVDQCCGAQIQGVIHIKLPHPQYLLPATGNKENRVKAHQQLVKLNEILKEDRFQPTGLIITADDLPDLQAKHLLLLKKLTDEQEKNSCFQVSKGGKLIEISNHHLDDSKADIHLTFSEVYTIRVIMDTLGVSEVDFVSANQESSTKPS